MTSRTKKPRRADERPIAFNPSYVISVNGEVRNRRTGRTLKAQYWKGYEVVTIRGLTGKKRNLRIHVLLAETFLGARQGMLVRHLDGDPSNNQLSNLAWGTPLDNVIDKLRHGRHLGPTPRNGRPTRSVRFELSPDQYERTRKLAVGHGTTIGRLIRDAWISSLGPQ